ncbi:MAG TPA: tRNA epoxyqueuosine(34) reductase QueG [Steroidobacteraceae bacterium]
MDFDELAATIKHWGRELGFQRVGIAGIALPEDEQRLLAWLAAERHGTMAYMHRHGTRRSRPADLVPGTLRVITARMDYWPEAAAPDAVLADPTLGYVSRYALGRDYHKVLRGRLAQLADRLAAEVGAAGYRAFTDSAPVLEKALARNAGLGWIGKHTNLLDRHDGSWFFLGEVFTDLPLPVDEPVSAHCGSCTACIDVCPTQAIVAPYELDARRCISYLTIEHTGAIPESLRAALGNRIYGCDDCQLVCPWNRYAKVSAEAGFHVRHGLDAPSLVGLFGWTEAEFIARTEGSAIRRIGYERWLRNIAVALGNAPTSEEITRALESRRDDASEVVREHVAWALERHRPSPGRTADLSRSRERY